MKLTASLLALAVGLTPVFAAVPEWGQCGGIGYTGETTCVSGTSCVFSNNWYSQCLKSGTATTTTAGTTTQPTTTTQATATAVPTGFVGTSGTKFTLNGSKYTVVGSNSYWVGLSGLSAANMNVAFSDMAKMGATTIRTWGFSDVTSANGIYYQSWSGKTATINTGSTGLGNFDNIVAAAKANGIRLIVPLSGNWGDYGGMDVYVTQLLGSSAYHDQFYTDATVIAAFKNYINAFVTRYKNEPTILAWELANEPRCKGSAGTQSGSCTTATITKWAKDISAYIKSIDSNHLVGLGDEGFYNQPSAPTYPYQGGEGIDFDANLAITTLDFGTFHSYPEGWGQTDNPQAWGTQWIIDHAASQTKLNKPVIIEEFGVTANQVTVYTAWYNAIVSSGLAGDLIWQSGSHLSSGDLPGSDGYEFFPGSSVYTLATSHAATLKNRA